MVKLLLPLPTPLVAKLPLPEMLTTSLVSFPVRPRVTLFIAVVPS